MYWVMPLFGGRCDWNHLRTTFFIWKSRIKVEKYISSVQKYIYLYPVLEKDNLIIDSTFLCIIVYLHKINSNQNQKTQLIRGTQNAHKHGGAEITILRNSFLQVSLSVPCFFIKPNWLSFVGRYSLLLCFSGNWLHAHENCSGDYFSSSDVRITCTPVHEGFSTISFGIKNM